MDAAAGYGVPAGVDIGHVDVAIRYPGRRDLAVALRRLETAGP